jgi:hypothetical protein
MVIKVYRVTLLTADGYETEDVIVGTEHTPAAVNWIVNHAISRRQRASCAVLSVRQFSDEEMKEYERSLGRRLNLDDLPDCASHGGVFTEPAFLAAFNNLLQGHPHAKVSYHAEDSVLINWVMTLS